MNGEIVWVFGPSGVGKKYLIDRLREDGSQQLREILDIEDAVVCEESTVYDRSKTYKPLKFEHITRLVKPNKSVLIKFQGIALDENLLLRLKSDLPNTKFRIIFLCATEDQFTENINNSSRQNLKDLKYHGAYKGNFIEHSEAALKYEREQEFEVLYFNHRSIMIKARNSCYEALL